jgi:SAM-dependent methyltransferase
MPNNDNLCKNARYLKVTYDPLRCPVNEYPYLLAQHLARTAFGAPGRLVDLGCGRGDHLAAFAAHGFDVTGVDMSPCSGASGYRTIIADLEEDDIFRKTGEADCVFSKSVIEHLRNPHRLLESGFKMLRPGGRAVIMTPSWEYNYWGPFYVDHTHVTPFTACSLAAALEIAGFENIKVTYFPQLPFVWRHPVLKVIPMLLRWLPVPYRPFRPAPWPEALNKVIRFSKEIMLLATAVKPLGGAGDASAYAPPTNPGT